MVNLLHTFQGQDNSVLQNKTSKSICLDSPLEDKIRENFMEITPDIKILNIAYSIAREKKFKHVIFVTKDVNLRLKARSIGLETQNYNSGIVEDLSEIYTGLKTMENIGQDIFDDLYKKPHEIQKSKLGKEVEFLFNENVILKNGSKSALAFFDGNSQTVRLIQPKSCYGMWPQNWIPICSPCMTTFP